MSSLQSQESSELVVRTKRRSTALSCAECRRLKLKCSRIFPCSNCVKKGCSQICPEGSLTTGKGNRFVLANTEALHEKINDLANRVRALEDGLAESHRMHSTYTHPLLTEELLQIKRPLERERFDTPAVKDEKTEPADAIESIGSLSISNGGRSTFFGQGANSWYLLQNEEGSGEENGEDREHSSPLPLDPSSLSAAFPFAPPVNKMADDDIRASLIGRLPQTQQATRICDLYFRHAAWMYTPIPEQDFWETVFRPIYESEGAYQEKTGSHNLSILYMALALGTLLDLEKPAHNAEAMNFFQLARAALSLDSLMDEQSIPGIQALIMMCHFMFLSDMGGPRWVVMGMVVKLAQSLGLHRDSGKWNLDPSETHKRRQLFYELLTYDSWQSLTFGRPPSLSMLHVDSKLPHDTVKNENGEIEMSFSAWKHRFCSQCLNIVHDQAFGARPPSYNLVQDLDRKVRTWYIPPSLRVPGFGGAKHGTETEPLSVQLFMQRYIAYSIREITLFYMHRGYFAQAMETNPDDPMGSKYAPSVLAAYNSATSFVGLINSLFQQYPDLTERMWFLFTHVFSCAIVLGSIAVKTRMQLARSALSSLEAAYNLFSRVSDVSRKNKVLPVLQRLRERAIAAFATANSTGEPSYFSPASVKSEPDEFSGLNGMRRLVSRRSPSSSSYTGSSPLSQPTSPPLQTMSQESSVRFTEPDSPTRYMNGHGWQHQQQQHQQYNRGSIPQSPTYSQHSDQTGYPMDQRQEPFQAHQHVDVTMGYGQHVPVEPTPDFYGYQHTQNYNMHMMQSMGPEMSSPHQQPHYLPVDSWQNFISQYK